jgi:hypothetical protein
MREKMRENITRCVRKNLGTKKTHSKNKGIGKRLSGICVGIFHSSPYTMRHEKEKYLGKARVKMKEKEKRDLLKYILAAFFFQT